MTRMLRLVSPSADFPETLRLHHMRLVTIVLTLLVFVLSDASIQLSLCEVAQAGGADAGLVSAVASGTISTQQPVRTVWIGTGRNPLSKGIYVCTLNPENGKLSSPVLAAEADGPGWVTTHPNGATLYAGTNVDGKPSIVAYRVIRPEQVTAEELPQLRFLNAVEVGDGGATHLSVDSTGRMLVSAQYGGGSVAAFALNDDGSLRERTQLVDHEGGSRTVPGRQDGSHAHWAGFSPDNRFVLVPDLGLDKVMVYSAKPETASLESNGAGSVPPGGGPRHMKFDPTGRFAWVLNELSLTITTFAWDADQGKLTPIETVPTVPDAEKAKEKAVSASEIRVHPSGKFVYSANRGHDTISAFRVDSASGRLSLIERENARAATPRNFNLDPSGRWLLVAGQDSHTLGVFEVDQTSGELTWAGSSVFAPAAICVLIE